MLSGPPDESVPQHFGIAPPAEHGDRHADDLGLELGRAGPDVGVQRVALRVDGVDLVEEIDVGLIAVVHRPRNETILPAGLLLITERFHFGDDRLPVNPALWQALV